MKLFITGAGGFLGSAVRDCAVARGHEVSALVRKPTASDHPNLTYVDGDLRAPGAWTEALAGHDAVIHLAESELASAVAGLARVLRPGGWLALATHVGDAVHHVEEFLGEPVQLDFVLHDAVAVREAVAAAGLEVVEWYVRGPIAGAEVPNLKPKLSQEKQRAELDLIQTFNRAKLEQETYDPQVEGLIKTYELGYRMQSEMPAVMDLDKETPATRSLYGIDEEVTGDFGRKCLLARRMIEAGVRNWNRHMAMLDRQLALTGAFVLGDQFTLADIVLGLATNRWFMTPMERPPLAAVSAYYERLSQRPAYLRHGRNGVP